MSIFVNVTPASVPKTANVRAVGLLLAGIFTVMAVAQLFTFEDFPALIADFLLPSGSKMAPLIAATIVTFEIFAIPFLLGMALSPLMRWTSMIFGWVVVAMWILISLWLNLADTVATTAGFLGTTVKVPVGWWTVFFSLALAILMVWVSWGQWPASLQKK